ARSPRAPHAAQSGSSRGRAGSRLAAHLPPAAGRRRAALSLGPQTVLRSVSDVDGVQEGLGDRSHQDPLRRRDDMTSYVLSGLLTGVVEGAVLYVVDFHLGVRLYRWWYDLTHGEQLPADLRRGFIHDRKANARFTTAMLVSLGQNGIAFALGLVNPFWAMLTI